MNDDDLLSPRNLIQKALTLPPVGSGIYFQLVFNPFNPFRFLRHSLRFRLFLVCVDHSSQGNHVPDYIDVDVSGRRLAVPISLAAIFA